MCALKILLKVSGFFSAGLPCGGLLGARANTLRPSSEKSRTSAHTHSLLVLLEDEFTVYAGVSVMVWALCVYISTLHKPNDL